MADAPVQLSELATMIQCDGRTQNGTTCRYNGMSIGMENDTKELAYGIFGTPENSLVFSCPLNLNWQCIPSYGVPGLQIESVNRSSIPRHKQIHLVTCSTCQGSAQSWLRCLINLARTSEVRLLRNSFLQIDIYVNMLMMCLLPDVVVSY